MLHFRSKYPLFIKGGRRVVVEEWNGMGRNGLHDPHRKRPSMFKSCLQCSKVASWSEEKRPSFEKGVPNIRRREHVVRKKDLQHSNKEANNPHLKFLEDMHHPQISSQIWVLLWPFRVRMFLISPFSVCNRVQMFHFSPFQFAIGFECF